MSRRLKCEDYATATIEASVQSTSSATFKNLMYSDVYAEGTFIDDFIKTATFEPESDSSLSSADGTISHLTFTTVALISPIPGDFPNSDPGCSTSATENIIASPINNQAVETIDTIEVDPTDYAPPSPIKLTFLKQARQQLSERHDYVASLLAPGPGIYTLMIFPMILFVCVVLLLSVAYGLKTLVQTK